MSKEYRYRIVFHDEPAFDPWVFNLFTTEQKTNSDIESLIEYYSEVNSRNHESGGYCPVDIMDDLVRDNDGWRWEDGDDEIVIMNW